ncbi:MAG: hypothetical protein JO001_01830 [Alphaproteobacteria bacterium]|nr:hypothetical protein [Alphaproteobacteria bacterium]
MAVNFTDPADVVDAVAKIAITQALDHIPVVGGVLSAVVEAIWPDSTPNYPTADEIFNELKDRIAGMIGTAISQNDVAVLQQSLSDIGNVIADYQDADNYEALAQFIATKTTIDGKLDDFKLKGQEVVLLPLYVQAINAYFSFLRDGLIACPNWVYPSNVNPQIKYNEILKDLHTAFASAQTYTQATYATGLKAVTPSPPLSGFDQFNKVNDYVREMTLRTRLRRALAVFLS